MLDLMRKKAQSLVIQIIVGLIALVFIFWGVGGGGTGRNTMAMVNDEEITIQEYQQAYERTVNAYREQFGSSISGKLLEQLGIKQQVLRRLVQQALLRQGAREMGIAATDHEVRQAIQKMAAFKEKGIFSMKRYEEILSGSRLTPGIFESSVRSDLLSGKVMDHLGRFADVTPREANDRYQYEQEAVTVEYALLPADTFTGQVTVNDKDLAVFFESRKDDYKTEPRVKVQYLFFPAENEKATVTEDDARAFYASNSARFITPEERRARHILLKASETDPAEVLQNKKAQAEKIRELALADEDFAALAKKYSEGPSAPNGGDLGFFARGRMVREFDDTVFAMLKGEVSGVVRTRFGFHVIKLEEVRPGSTKSFETVREAIQQELAAKKAKDLAFGGANKAYEMMVLAGSLEKYATAEKMPLQETGFIGRVPGAQTAHKKEITDAPAFRAAALALQKGELSSLVALESGYAILYAVDKKAAQVPPLADVRARVEKDCIAAKALELAEKEAEKWLAALRTIKAANAFIEQVAARKLSLREAGPFIRMAAPSDVPVEMVTSARALSAEQPYPASPVLHNGMVYVYRLKEKSVPDATTDPMKDAAFVKRMVEEKRQRLLSSWLDFLEKRAEITINEKLLGV